MKGHPNLFVTGKFLSCQYRNKEENALGTEDLFLYRQIFVKSVFVRTIFDCTQTFYPGPATRQGGFTNIISLSKLMFKNYFTIFQDSVIILQPNIQHFLHFFPFLFFSFSFSFSLFFFHSHFFSSLFFSPSLPCLQNLVPAYKRRLQDCGHCRSLYLPFHAISKWPGGKWKIFQSRCTYVILSIIVSEIKVISVERWMKTYVLACTKDWSGPKPFVVLDFANCGMIQ